MYLGYCTLLHMQIHLGYCTLLHVQIHPGYCTLLHVQIHQGYCTLLPQRGAWWNAGGCAGRSPQEG